MNAEPWSSAQGDEMAWQKRFPDDASIRYITEGILPRLRRAVESRDRSGLQNLSITWRSDPVVKEVPREVLEDMQSAIVGIRSAAKFGNWGMAKELLRSVESRWGEAGE